MSKTRDTNALDSPAIGTVYIVGGGPGDPRYITLRGVQCLGRADVILYDYLVNERLLDHAGADAERICLGRHGRNTVWNQDQINREMVHRARRGQTVVRLKSGDPSIFGRFAEELGFLQAQAVPCEVVPGVSAAIAAGSCVGIPLTHRDLSSAVAFVTGQENSAKRQDTVDYEALARFPGTLVIYMGVTTVDRWAPGLLSNGMAADTPVALIRRCSFYDQQVVRCQLKDVVAELTPRQKLPPPVIAVVGDVARSDQQLGRFVARPLFGQAVLVTRARDQLHALSDQLLELGAGVWHQAAIEVRPPASWHVVDEVLDRVDQFDWLVFSSANGVSFLLNRILDRGQDLRRLGSVRLAAMGPGTADKLRAYHLQADVVPGEFRAEALADKLAENAAGKRFLLARASRGREVLAETLRAAGGDVEQVVVYESHDVAVVEPDIAAALEAGRLDWTTVTSSAIARSLVNLFGPQLRRTRLASISPVTSVTLRELGYEPAVEASVYTMDGLVEAICAAQKK
jgi:uroporphyrinogen III methyltransferase/synthase